MPRFLASFLIASSLISPLAVFAQEIPTESQGTIAEPVEAPYQSIPVYLFASEAGDIIGIIPITPNLALGCVGHIVSQTEAENQQGTLSDPICSLYRLTTASTTFATTSTDYIRTYAYSPTGNITNKSDQGSYSYQGDQGTSYANPHAVTDVGGTTHTYDKNGNLTSDTVWTYGWNYNNTLASSTNGVITVNYGYDHNKQRISYDNGTFTTYYPNKYYNTSTATTTRHIFANGQLVATIEGNGTATSTNYIHTDHLGGTHIVTDENGNKAQLLDYYPFGDLRLNETDALDEQRKFTGHEYDDDTDLTYANARYYLGTTARFLSQDPVAAYIPETFLIDPQQLNMYAYARNNPLRFIDPLGLWTDDGNGSFIAEKGDTLSGLQQQTGRNWQDTGFSRDPRTLQIGETVSFNNPTTYNGPTIDSSLEATKQYFGGNGESVNLGPNAQNALKNSDEQKYHQERIVSGVTPLDEGDYGINLTFEQFYIGDTNVDYHTTRGTKFGVTTFDGFFRDGFWDVVTSWRGDGPGPKRELPGGTPYSFNPYSWTISYPAPN